MKQLGSLMALLGAGSFVLDFFNMQFILLAWVDNWGPTVALIIRIGLIVVGAGLWFFASKKETEAA